MNTTEAWNEILERIQERGEPFTDANGKENLELINIKITINDVKDYKKPLHKMMQQTEFIYPSMEQMEKLVLEKKGLTTNFANRMLDYEGMNQLRDFVIPLLKKDPKTRRAVMTTYNPLIDSTIDSKTVISMMNFFFRIKENKVHLSIFIRSMDCFLGFPANMVQATIIQEEVAKSLKLSPGSITFFVGSAHIYSDYQEIMKKMMK